MGVEFTQHPELYNAVVIQVPLLDMIRISKIAAGASWEGEYGDVNADPAVMAALVAAVDAVWPRPKRSAPPGPDLDRVRAWRFSGRWWSRPATSRRVRPRI